MTFKHRHALTAFALFLPIFAQAEEVKYFASGWPIALAEAACDDDEGCLTQLANCPPGTDGVCTDQVATCRLTENANLIFEALCVTSTTGEGSNTSTTLTFPDRDYWDISRNDHGIVQVNGQNARLDEQGCVIFDLPERKFCVEPITDQATFETWANGKGD